MPRKGIFYAFCLIISTHCFKFTKLGEIEKRTLVPYALVLRPSANRPKHDTQGKGTPIQAYPNPSRSCLQLSFADYLKVNLIRIFDTNSSYPQCPAPQLFTPPFCHYNMGSNRNASAKIVIILETKKKSARYFHEIPRW